MLVKAGIELSRGKASMQSSDYGLVFDVPPESKGPTDEEVNEINGLIEKTLRTPSSVAPLGGRRRRLRTRRNKRGTRKPKTRRV